MKKLILLFLLIFPNPFNAWGASPTAIYTDATHNVSAYISAYVDYPTTRNSTVGTASYYYIGVSSVGGEYTVGRSGHGFDVSSITAGSTITSCKYYFSIATDTNTDAVILCAGNQPTNPTYLTGFNTFRGWAASGAYTGILGYGRLASTGDTNAHVDSIAFNQRGLDSLSVHLGTSVAFLTYMIAARDSAGSTPANRYYATESGDRYLWITYTLPGYSKTVMGVPTPAKPFYGIDKTGVTKVFGVL